MHIILALVLFHMVFPRASKMMWGFIFIVLGAFLGSMLGIDED